MTLDGDGGLPVLTAESTLGEWLKHPVGGQILMGALAQAGDQGMGAMLADPSLMRMAESMPLSRVAAFPGSPVTAAQLDQLVAAANGRPPRLAPAPPAPRAPPPSPHEVARKRPSPRKVRGLGCYFVRVRRDPLRERGVRRLLRV